MKRYIRTSSYRRRELPRYQEWIKALKQDIRNVAACRNEEDLANLEIKSWNSNSEKQIWNSRFEKMGVTDFDEKIDLIIDWLYDSVKYAKDTESKYSKEVEIAKQLHFKIMRYLDDLYGDAKIKDFGINHENDTFEITPNEMTRSNLIKFIDDIINEFGGKYHGTGRGGSWTSWNVLLPGEDGINIEYQIGPSEDNSMWVIREV